MYKLGIRDALKMKLDQHAICISCRNYSMADVHHEFIRFYYPKRNSGMYFLTKVKPKLRGGNNEHYNTL